VSFLLSEFRACRTYRPRGEIRGKPSASGAGEAVHQRTYTSPGDLLPMENLFVEGGFL